MPNRDKVPQTPKSDVPPKFSEDTHKKSHRRNEELDQETDFERTGRESLLTDEKTNERGRKTSRH